MPLGHLLINSKSLERTLFTENPEFTYFKSVYKKVSEFSIEDVNQYFVNDYGFSKRSSCILHNNGDLINIIYFVATLPNISYLNEYDLYGTSFRWVDNVGEKLIKSVEIEIDNKIIQKISGLHINILNRLNKKKRKIDYMIGNIHELTTFSNSKKEYKLYIPIPFWFSESIGNSFPISKFDINKIKLNIEIEDISNLIIYGPTYYIEIKESHVLFDKYEYIYQSNNNVIAQFFYFDKNLKRLYYNLISKNNFQQMNNSIYENLINIDSSFFITNKEKNIFYVPTNVSYSFENINININYITLNDAYFQIRYIFLDKLEQKIIRETKNLEYIIKQYKYITYNNIESIKNIFNINGNNSVFDISWITLLEDDIVNKNFFKYSDSILFSSLKINSFDIYSKRDNNSIKLVNQFYNYKDNLENYNINSYIFSNDILSYQPSGSLNLNKIEKCNLYLEFDKSISSQKRINLYIIVSSYNIISVKKNKIDIYF